jgi:hypothetical protein
VYRGGGGLYEKQGLGWNRVVQFFGVLGIVTADADNFAKGQMNRGGVVPMVLIIHNSVLQNLRKCRQSIKAALLQLFTNFLHSLRFEGDLFPLE